MVKRLVHYVILAAVLVGVPLACCWLGGYESMLEGVKQFPPRTEDWGLHPENLWNVRRPFSWGVFVGMALFTFVCMFPLVRRCCRAMRQPAKSSIDNLSIVNCQGDRRAIDNCVIDDCQGDAIDNCVIDDCQGGIRTFEHSNIRTFPRWGWAGVILLIVSWVIAWNRFEIFRSHNLQVMLSYFPIWIGFILTMNALTKWRSGRCPLTDHPGLYLATFPASALFWWFFEYLNRFVWNWYYLGVGGLSAAEYVVYATLCFASVLPGVYAVAEFLGTFRFFDDRNCDGMAKVNVRSTTSRIVLAILSAVGLVGIVFCPDYVYPFLWISPLMVFVLVQVLLKEPSVLDRLALGSWGLVFRFEVAALCCGFCWETWNYYALAKWVYAVPWVHGFQIWEMPLIGFAGYLPFGVECAAVIAWIYGKSFDRLEKGV